MQLCAKTSKSHILYNKIAKADCETAITASAICFYSKRSEISIIEYRQNG